MKDNNGKIFVSVANYRDTETQPTIDDLLLQASFPNRIVFGVLSQVVLPVDNDCIAKEHPQVRQLIVDARESKGPCLARSRILTELRQDEPYVLQIDSHTRAVPGWDEKMISMLDICPSTKSLLSCYPSSYVPPRNLEKPLICWCLPKKFNGNGILELDSGTFSYGARPSNPIPTPFVGAGFIFAPAAAFDEVPYDPYLYFHGEEMTYSVRLWTHGWNVFAPNDVFLYHDYSKRKRPKHWDDHTDWAKLDVLASQRTKYMLDISYAAPLQALIEIEKYGIGSKRTVKDFESYAGINFADCKIDQPRKTNFELQPNCSNFNNING